MDPANVLTDLFTSSIDHTVQLSDNSLRDGEQAPGVAYTVAEKVDIARQLDAFGVHSISVGFPAVSEQERECIRELLGAGLKIPRVVAFARLVKADIDHVAALELPWISLFVPTSEWHVRDKLGTSDDVLLSKMEEMIPYAVSCGLQVQFAFEDATRTPLPKLLRFMRHAEDLGALCLGIADTVGILTPPSTYRLFSLLRRAVRGKLACHFHNDLGMATANAVAAVEAGTDLADCTVLGLGERTGNSRLEELAVILQVKYGLDLGVRLDRIGQLTETVARAAGVAVPANKPIVGAHCFSHESGIHAKGILSNPICYQPFPPDLVGRSHELIYGKHSGLASVQALLERVGVELSEAEQRSLLEQVKARGARKEEVSEEWVVAKARELSS